MTFSNGVDGYFAYSAETTKGTRVVPAIALPLVQESMQDSGSQPIPHKGIIKGRKLMTGAEKTKSDVGGQIRIPMIADGLGGLLKAALGTNATTGSDPYEHEMSRGALGSTSIQIGWEDSAGTDFRKDYVGAMINGFSFDVQADQSPEMQFDIKALSEANDGSAAIEPSYGTLSYFEFSDATVDLDAGGNLCFDTFSLAVDNGLHKSTAICPTTQGRTEYSDQGAFSVGGSIGWDFTDWTYYDKFIAGTQATISALFNAGTDAKLQFDLRVLFTGSTPQISGPERIKEGLTFVGISATSDADGFTATLTNGDSSI